MNSVVIMPDRNETNILKHPDHHIALEDTLSSIGLGKFQYYLFTICGCVIMMSGVSITSVSFVVPAAQCDLKMTSIHKGILGGMSMLGMFAGSYFWGYWADLKGRKTVLLMSVLIDTTFNLLSSVSQSYVLFTLCRFICGFGTSGITVLYTYLGEFLSSKHREKLLCGMELFWTAGIIIVPCIAWVIIPMPFRVDYYPFSFSSWNLFVIICSCPSLILAYAIYTLPETPTFLLGKGKYREAVECLEVICAFNNIKKLENFNLTTLTSNVTEEMAGEEPCFVQGFYFSGKSLMQSKYCVVAVQTCIIQFCSATSYYMLLMWFPELMNRFRFYENLYPDNFDFSMCEIVFMFKNETTKTRDACVESIDSRVFINVIIIGLAGVPSSLAMPFLVKLWGMRTVLMISFFGSGISAACLYVITSSVQNMILSSVFEALSGVGITLMFCICVDLFPTQHRGLAMSLGSTFGRIGALMGNVVLGMFIDVHCSVPIILSCSFLMVSALLVLTLPNTKETVLK